MNLLELFWSKSTRVNTLYFTSKVGELGWVSGSGEGEGNELYSHLGLLANILLAVISVLVWYFSACLYILSCVICIETVIHMEIQSKHMETMLGA